MTKKITRVVVNGTVIGLGMLLLIGLLPVWVIIASVPVIAFLLMYVIAKALPEKTGFRLFMRAVIEG